MDLWSRKEIVDAAYVCTVGHCRSQRWLSRLPGLLGIPPVVRHPRWLLAQRNARTPLPPLYTADELWSLLGPSAREALASRIKTGNLKTDFGHWATIAPSLLDRPLSHSELVRLQDQGSSWLDLFFFIAPEPGHEQPTLDGPKFVYFVPTAFLRSLIAAAMCWGPTQRPVDFTQSSVAAELFEADEDIMERLGGEDPGVVATLLKQNLALQARQGP
jgi:hypothetical protein